MSRRLPSWELPTLIDIDRAPKLRVVKDGGTVVEGHITGIEYEVSWSEARLKITFRGDVRVEATILDRVETISV